MSERTIIIAANGEYTERISGHVFAVHSATASFKVQTDKDGKRTMVAGGKFGTPGGKSFKRLRFFETSGADNTITWEVSDEDISPNTPQGSAAGSNVALVNTAVSPTENIVLIALDDTVQVMVPGSVAYFSSIRIYPGKAAVAGVLTANALGDVYVGRSGLYLPDRRTTADADYPVEYIVPAGGKVPLSSIRIRGKATDGVFYSYTPAP